MKPGRELDALVAEKVMGCRVQKTTLGLCELGTGEERVYRDARIPHYSTDIASVWGVVEKFAPEAMVLNRYPTGNFAVRFDHNGHWWSDVCDTAPHAICLAALKAVGVTETTPLPSEVKPEE